MAVAAVTKIENGHTLSTVWKITAKLCTVTHIGTLTHIFPAGS